LIATPDGKPTGNTTPDREETMTEIMIRTDVPLPPRTVASGGGRRPKYPFDKLAVGHSFLVAFDEMGDDEDNKKLRTRVTRACTAANKAAKEAENGKHFQVRVEEAGVGVWRTK
jgi:hypothetical protein